MAYPGFSLPFIVHCDTSKGGLGAVLYQKQNDKMKVTSYASRILAPAEKNYHLHSCKLEFLALRWAITNKFRDYLYNVEHFTVYSDKNPLSYVMKSSKLNASGMRRASELSNGNFSIKYQPQKASADCNYLSHTPVKIFENHTEETDFSVSGSISNLSTSSDN